MDLSSLILGLWFALVPTQAQAATALTATQLSIVYGSDDCYRTDPDNRYVLGGATGTTEMTYLTTTEDSFGLLATVSGSGGFTVGAFSNNNSTFDIGTGATSGGYASLVATANNTASSTLAFGTSRQCLKWRSAPINASLVQRMEIIGFGSSVVNGTGYATGGASSCICFRIDVTVANSNLFAVTKNGASETATDTGVIQVLDTMQTFEIIGTSTSVSFYINGAPVATNTANITATALAPIFSSRTKENASKGTQIDWMQFSRPRS